MADTTTTITISGKVGYKSQITPAQAAQIIAFLEAEEGAAPILGTQLNNARNSNQGGSSKGVESAREALNLSGAKTNREKIVALGAYILQAGDNTFKAEDVKTQFQRARETVPKNISRDLNSAVAAGWLADADDGEYYVTNKIQGIFDGEFKFPKLSNGSSRRTARPATKSSVTKDGGKPEVFEAIDEFPATMDGFHPYSKMKSNKDKLLWVVRFAKERDVKGLANKDIAWLTDHLGAGIPGNQISAAFDSARKSGYANKSTQDNTIRITEGGETHLRTPSVAQSE